MSLDEVRAVWETNVFGVLAVYQAMSELETASLAAKGVRVGVIAKLGTLPAAIADPTSGAVAVGTPEVV